ncbi:putative dihydrofolate reductase [Erwinia phage vB_EamM_Special G]|uniref:dihydrofolate reductase n=1 Tax=Erwinia phage vB_EamM_Special G TaxID=1815989 RepID=A0A191ZC20_9CAUD|nr:dihydrofolate reductase [Erwinia phage vB_EamM_Special G]ANJ64934.1 putative dihydrofolate reductase [Erwinia phage vB_EamM_Special G]
MHIQDMTFHLRVDTHVNPGPTYNTLRLVNQDEAVVIEHPITIGALNDMSNGGDYDSDEFKKAAAAFLYTAYLYTRDYPEGKGAASYDFHRTAGIILAQYLDEEHLGEFEPDDWNREEIRVPGNPDGVSAFVFSNDGSDINIRIYRQDRGLVNERLFTYSDEETVPSIEEMLAQWDADVAPAVDPVQENAASISFGDVSFIYTLDMSKEGREQRKAIMQVVIGDRLVAQQKVHENTQPLMYYMMEVFNMLALRMTVGPVEGINAQDRVTLLTAISGFVGGHLAMPDQVQIAEGMQYMHEGAISDEVTYMVSHQLIADNHLRATYQFNTVVDETMRRSITMCDEVSYLENPMSPQAFFTAYQADLSRELKLSRMFDIAMIAAIDRGQGLGKDNELLYRIKEDMKYFKEMTLHSPVIMGRKTYESLPNPLVDRLNIVITTAPTNTYTTRSGVVFVNSKEEALLHAKGYLAEHGGDKIWIIGGASIYAAFLPDAKEIHLTTIGTEREDADTFFPEVDLRQFNAARQFEEDQVFEREGETFGYNRVILTRK